MSGTLVNFEEAKKCEVLDPKGGKHLFGNVLKDGRPYLVSMLRHFGCISCAEHVDSFLTYKEKFKELGLNFVFIGNGQYKELKDFVVRMNLIDDKLIVLTDPSLEIFKQLGLKYSFFSTVHYKSVLNIVRASKKGHKNLPTKNGERGSHFQQGGLLMLDSAQNIEYYFRSEHMGDKPDCKELLNIASELF